MLQQGLIKIGNATAFIDKHSDLCIDGKPCDTNGDTIYVIGGKIVRERDFKDYRKFSPQFRQHLIMEDIQQSGASLRWSAF